MLVSLFPAVNCRAIVERPSGTKELSASQVRSATCRVNSRYVNNSDTHVCREKLEKRRQSCCEDASYLLGIGLLGLLSAGCGGASNSGTGELSFREQVAQEQRETDPELRAKQLIRIGAQQADHGRGPAEDIAAGLERL